MISNKNYFVPVTSESRCCELPTARSRWTLHQLISLLTPGALQDAFLGLHVFRRLSCHRLDLVQDLAQKVLENSLAKDSFIPTRLVSQTPMSSEGSTAIAGSSSRSLRVAQQNVARYRIWVSSEKRLADQKVHQQLVNDVENTIQDIEVSWDKTSSGRNDSKQPNTSDPGA